MALWHLLILVGFGLSLGAAVAPAQFSRVGPGGYVLAIAVGVVVGVGCGWTMWITHRPVGDYIQQHSSLGGSAAKLEWYFSAFYLAKIMWVAFAGFLAFWLSSALLRVVFHIAF